MCRDLFASMSEDDDLNGCSGITSSGLRTLTQLAINSCQVSNACSLQEQLEQKAMPTNSCHGQACSDSARMGYDIFASHVHRVLRDIYAVLQAELIIAKEGEQTQGLVVKSGEVDTPRVEGQQQHRSEQPKQAQTDIGQELLDIPSSDSSCLPVPTARAVIITIEDLRDACGVLGNAVAAVEASMPVSVIPGPPAAPLSEELAVDGATAASPSEVPIDSRRPHLDAQSGPTRLAAQRDLWTPACAEVMKARPMSPLARSVRTTPSPLRSARGRSPTTSARSASPVRTIPVNMSTIPPASATSVPCHIVPPLGHLFGPPTLVPSLSASVKSLPPTQMRCARGSLTPRRAPTSRPSSVGVALSAGKAVAGPSRSPRGRRVDTTTLMVPSVTAVQSCSSLADLLPCVRTHSQSPTRDRRPSGSFGSLAHLGLGDPVASIVAPASRWPQGPPPPLPAMDCYAPSVSGRLASPLRGASPSRGSSPLRAPTGPFMIMPMNPPALPTSFRSFSPFR